MGAVLGGFLSLIGSAFSGLVTVKTKQADVLQAGLQVISNISSSDAEKASAVASIYATDSMSESWLSRNWRPLTILMLTGFFIARIFFGFHPVGLTPALDELFMEIYGSLTGVYIGGRSLEKIAKVIMQTGAVKTFINKQIL